MKFVTYFREGNLKTLDIASGGGAFSIVAGLKGNHVIALDYEAKNIEVCNENRNAFGLSEKQVEFRQLDIKKIDLLNEKFDQVICFEILEHIIDDESVVKKIANITKKGSYVLVSVPNLFHKPLYNETVSDVENGGHVRFGYSFEQLESLFTRNGFQILKRDSCSGNMTQFVTSIEAYIAKKLFGDKMPRIFSAILFVFLYPLTYLDILIPGEDLSIFILAQRN